MQVAGHFQGGSSSRRVAATLRCERGQVRVVAEGGDLLAVAERDEFEVSSRLGNTPRFIRFKGGEAFETADNDGVDRLLPAAGAGLLHHLESRLRYVLLGVLVTVAFVWVSVQWGVPMAARAIAASLPQSVHAHADSLVLELIDRQMMAPSRLDATEQQRLQALFAPLAAELGEDPPIRVLFRLASDEIGANALALPGGTIVFTDQLVGLARSDEELIGVLAHEIGHVAHRHAMRRSIQASMMGVLAAVVVGDVSAVSSAVTALPLILTELGYSRGFEREADDHAVDMMRRHGVDPRHLANMLQRLDPAQGGVGSYLSTHPPTPERVRAIHERAAQ